MALNNIKHDLYLTKIPLVTTFSLNCLKLIHTWHLSCFSMYEEWLRLWFNLITIRTKKDQIDTVSGWPNHKIYGPLIKIFISVNIYFALIFYSFRTHYIPKNAIECLTEWYSRGAYLWNIYTLIRVIVLFSQRGILHRWWLSYLLLQSIHYTSNKTDLINIALIVTCLLFKKIVNSKNQFKLVI